jgi:hypothetical protein
MVPPAAEDQPFGPLMGSAIDVSATASAFEVMLFPIYLPFVGIIAGTGPESKIFRV